MAYSIPIRLSAALASHAREVAAVQDRSLTEQVEHWARLGQLVERALSARTVEQMKGHSYDRRLPEMLAFADSPAGKARAIALLRERDELHPIDKPKPSRRR